MKKALSKFLACTLILATVLACSVPASARESNYIRKTMATIAAIGDGQIAIDFHILAKRYMDSIGATKISLYTTTDDFVESYEYTDEGYEYMLISGEISFFDAVIFYDCTPGQSYYAIIEFYAGDSTGGDTDILSTRTVEAK